ncbi:sensor histidine kinase [Elizabethkingia anophelis]|uniref:sensor histidine kinase n=1 Tax=Elizabethkingia anophelis TaxID=1117645 RepID=UPI00389139EE
MKYIFIALFFSSISYKSQSPIYTWYDMNNALPQNSVKDIIKDKYGFIWIATENGILQYDGEKFEVFNKFKITDTHFGNFHGDVEKDSIVQFSIQQKQQVLLRNRKLEIPTRNLSVRTYTNHGDVFTLFNKNSINNTYDNDMVYYIITKRKEYYFFFNGNKIIHQQFHEKKALILPYGHMNNIFMNKDTLFIRNSRLKKIYMIRNGKLSEISAPDFFFAPATELYWQQMSNQTFIIKNNSLFLVHYNNGELKFEYLFTYNEISKSFRHSIYYDRDSNKLFLGSLTKGLKIITLSNFIKPHPDNSSWDYAAYASLPYSDSTIITPQGQEIGRRGRLKNFHFSNSSGHNRFLMLYDDSKDLLLPIKNTLVRFNRKDNYKTNDSIHFGDFKIKNILKSKGFYFLSLSDIHDNYFLNVYKDDTFKEKYRTFLFKRGITSCVTIDMNTLLVGTSDGLYKILLSNNKVEKISKDINVKHIIPNKDNGYWITTNNQGFFLLKSFKLFSIPSDKNEYLFSTHYILEDRSQNLWLSSNNGLYRVPKKEIFTYLNNKKLHPHYYRYDTKNGLLNNEFNGSSYPNAYELPNNNFVFPSMEGFVIFNPDSVRTYYPSKNKMIIDRMRVNDEEVQSFNGKIKERSDFEHIEILIDIPYYSNQENLQIDFRLGNHHWKDLKGQRKLDIFNLKPGKYILTFRVFLGPELGYDYKIIQLEIVPFFYQTKTFSFLIILFLILTVISIIILRTKHLGKTNKILQVSLDDKSKQLMFEAEYQKRLMETISHDITTPLQFISMMMQKIMSSDDANLQKQYFNSIYRSSEELYKFTRNLKEYSDLFKEPSAQSDENCLIYEIAEEKRMLFEEIAWQKNIYISNNINPDEHIKINKNILNVILHNIIDNAVKYNENATIKIESCSNDEILEIQVKDSGKGMQKKQIIFYNELFKNAQDNNFSLKNIGFGLQLVIQLVKKCDAKISFENNIPKGTLIRITLKKKSV